MKAKAKKTGSAQKLKPVAVKKTAAKKTGESEPVNSEDMNADDSDASAVVLTGDAHPAKKGQMQKFLVDGLKDLYWAEQHLLKALAKMSSESTSEELRGAFKDHRIESEDHVAR